MKVIFPDSPEVTFIQWSLFAFPLAFIMLLLLWLGFCRFLLKDTTSIQFNMLAFEEQYRSLGSIQFAEGRIYLSLDNYLTFRFQHLC